MAHWKDYKEDWILFLEAGFIAVNQADEDAATKLFKAAEMLNPENTMPKVGHGLSSSAQARTQASLLDVRTSAGKRTQKRDGQSIAWHLHEFRLRPLWIKGKRS